MDRDLASVVMGTPPPPMFIWFNIASEAQNLEFCTPLPFSKQIRIVTQPPSNDQKLGLHQGLQ